MYGTRVCVCVFLPGSFVVFQILLPRLALAFCLRLSYGWLDGSLFLLNPCF